MHIFNKIVAVIGAVAFVAATPLAVSYAKSGGSSSSSSSSSSSKSSSGGSGYSKPSSSPSSSKPSSVPSSTSKPTPAPVTSKPDVKPSIPPKAVDTKPSTVSPKSDPPAATQNGYTKPAIGAAAGAAVVGGGAAAIAAQQSDPQKKSEPATTANKDPLAQANKKALSSDSLKTLQAERTQAQKPPQPIKKEEVKSNPVFNSTSKEYAGNPNRYTEQRNITYNIYRTQHPEMFSYNRGMSPNYGIYDSNFLTGMFIGAIGSNLMSNAMWLSAQQHQPWYPAYRADLERQAQDNVELRTKLAAMDAEIAKIKADKTPSKMEEVTKSATSLPSGIDAAVAISPEAIMAANSDSSSGLGILGIIGIVFVVGISASTLTYFLVKK